MIFGNNDQKLLIFQSSNILTISGNIQRYLTVYDDGKFSPKKYRQISSFTVYWETNFKTKYNEHMKIKKFLIILLKRVFSDKFINGY